MTHSQKVLIIGGISILFLGSIGVVALSYKNSNLSNDIKENGLINTDTGNDSSEVGISSDLIDTSDWKTYRNEEYGFEIQYPENWNYVKDSGHYNSIELFNFPTKLGYQAVLGINTFQSGTGRTIEDLRHEYDKSQAGNPGALPASEALMDISIGNQTGLENGNIACEFGHNCYARFEFDSNELLNKGLSLFVVVSNLKEADVDPIRNNPISSSYVIGAYSIFEEDMKIVRKVLSTFIFID